MTLGAALAGALIVMAFHALNPTPAPIPPWRMWLNRCAVAGFGMAVLWPVLVGLWALLIGPE